VQKKMKTVGMEKVRGAVKLMLAGLIASVFMLSAIVPASAGDFSKPEELVVKANLTFNNFVADPNMTWFRNNIKRAKAVFIVPQLLKAGFIFGGSGGSGALLALDSKTGKWSYPAFYTMGAASFGFQAGAQASEVVLMVMTEKGLNAMLSTSAKLGGDMSVAAGPVGAGASAATADVLAFSRTKGVFAGVSVEGSVIKTRDDWNKTYYGKPVTAVDIVIRRSVKNPNADKLIQTVTKATKK